MAKRSNEERHPRDFYPTPYKGALPLIRTLEAFHQEWQPEKPLRFVEPFAGNGALTDHLCSSPSFECVYESDIEPQLPARILKHDYRQITNELLEKVDADFIISNPPWINDSESGKLLFSLIDHLSALAPTWLLLDGGFAFNLGSEAYLRYCHSIVPVGRLKWIPDSKYTGTEDCAWFLFDQKTPMSTAGPVLHPREKWK